MRPVSGGFSLDVSTAIRDSLLSGVTRRRWFLPDHQQLGHTGQKGFKAMTKELSESVQKIRSLSPKLNSAVQEANQVVQLVEQFLNDECKAGLKCCVQISSAAPGQDYRENADDYEGMWLCYDRIGGKFRIVIEENTTEPDFVAQEDKIVKTRTPWSDAPKGAKLESFGSLPELLKSIATQIEDSIESTMTTAKTVGEILEALNGPTDDDFIRKTTTALHKIETVLRNTDFKVGYEGTPKRRWVITDAAGTEASFETSDDAMRTAVSMAQATSSLRKA